MELFEGRRNTESISQVGSALNISTNSGSENNSSKHDAGYLNKLTEAVRGSLQLTLREGETEIARESFEIRLLPPSQWSGTDAAPELLAAFVCRESSMKTCR
jgi:hypothetical protein